MFPGPMKNSKYVAFLLFIGCIISMLSGSWCSSAEQSSKKFTKAPEKGSDSGKHVVPDSSPIINGVLAGERDFLYIVALRDKAKPLSQYGAGSIVKRPGDVSQESEWIITARHNIIDIVNPKTRPSIVYHPLNVYPKYSNRDRDLPNYPVFNVKATYCHPWPKSQPIPIDDIALIELDRKIELNKPPYQFQSVNMVDKNFDINSWRGLVSLAGWGRNQTIPPMDPEYLMKTDLQVRPPDFCKTFYPNFRSIQKFCTARYEPDLSTSCHGDSGGPAVINDGGQELLAGVIVGGDRFCAYPSVEMKVAYYRDWINKVMVEKPRELNCSNLLNNRPP